jgi:hypothetical protein
MQRLNDSSARVMLFFRPTAALSYAAMFSSTLEEFLEELQQHDTLALFADGTVGLAPPAEQQQQQQQQPHRQRQQPELGQQQEQQQGLQQQLELPEPQHSQHQQPQHQQQQQQQPRQPPFGLGQLTQFSLVQHLKPVRMTHDKLKYPAPGETVVKLRNVPINLHRQGIIRGLLDAAGYATVPVVCLEHYRDAATSTGDPIPGLPDRAVLWAIVRPPVSDLTLSRLPRLLQLPGASGVVKLSAVPSCVLPVGPHTPRQPDPAEAQRLAHLQLVAASLPSTNCVWTPFGPLVPDQRPLPGMEAAYFSRCMQLAAAHAVPSSGDEAGPLDFQQSRQRPPQARPLPLPSSKKLSRKQRLDQLAVKERRMMKQYLKIELVRRCLDLEQQVLDPQFLEWKQQQQPQQQQQQKPKTPRRRRDHQQPAGSIHQQQQQQQQLLHQQQQQLQQEQHHLQQQQGLLQQQQEQLKQQKRQLRGQQQELLDQLQQHPPLPPKLRRSGGRRQRARRRRQPACPSATSSQEELQEVTSDDRVAPPAEGHSPATQHGGSAGQGQQRGGPAAQSEVLPSPQVLPSPEVLPSPAASSDSSHGDGSLGDSDFEWEEELWMMEAGGAPDFDSSDAGYDLSLVEYETAALDLSDSY